MNFGQAITVCLRHKYAEFTGRASRSEFWWFVLFNLLVSIAAAEIHPTLSLVVTLALLLPSCAVSVRRLHDIGRSGWWLLLQFVPLIGFLVLLFWHVQPSEPQDNAWGPPPA
ncbi:DUF805 domain-containing protein [Xylophilus sp. Kf1]|nr:DUF805 domain-containing protein [Xylophilus sp. Kf1]